VRLPGKGLGWKEFLKELKGELERDRILDVAAALTFYAALALFPFLLFLVALASVIIAPADAERLIQQLSLIAPGAATEILGDRIRHLGQQQSTTLLGFSAVGAIWAAAGGVAALTRALNQAYGVEEGRPFWKVRGIAILMTIVAGALALVAAIIAIGTAPLADRLGGIPGAAIGFLRLPVSGLLMMFLWALFYYALPDVEQRFKFITPGSIIGVFLWVLASWGFSRYVASFGDYDATYGSLGGVIVLFLWMWISSLVLLVGAEVNAIVEHRSEEGKRPGAKRRSDVGAASRSEARPAALAPSAAPARPAVPAPRGRGAGLTAVAAGFVAGLFLARRRPT
jgi:membrane protein